MGATFTKRELLIKTYQNSKSKKGGFAMMDKDFISKVSAYPYILNADNSFIDKFGPDGVSNLIKRISLKAVKFQSGFIYQYAFIMLLGFSIILTILIIN